MSLLAGRSNRETRTGEIKVRLIDRLIRLIASHELHICLQGIEGYVCEGIESIRARVLNFLELIGELIIRFNYIRFDRMREIETC